MNISKFNIFNLVAFYIFWWISIWGASQERYFIGPSFAIVYFAIHFIFIENKTKEFYLLISCFILGIIFENSLINFDFLEYKGILFNYYGIAPLWPLLLWGGFGLTLFHSSIFILGKLRFSFIIGGLFTPFIYLSAHKFGAISLKFTFLNSYIILGVSTGCIILLINVIATKIDD